MEQQMIEIQPDPPMDWDKTRIRSLIRAVFTIVTAYGLISVLQKMFRDEHFALPMMISVTVLFAGTLVFALVCGAKIRFTSAAAFIIGISAGAYAWLNDELFFQVFIAVHVIVLSYAFFVLSLFGNTNQRLSGGTFLLDLIKATFVYPFLSVRSFFSSVFKRKTAEKKSKHAFLFVLIGIAAAIVLGIITVSLLSFDPDFEKMFRFEWNWTFFSDLIGKLIFCIPLTILLFSMFTSSEKRKLPNMSTPETASRIGTRMKKVPAVVFLIPAAALFVIYGLFFFTQRSVYLSAFLGIVPDSFTAAEYARSGFFELCAVAAINAVVGVLMSLFMNESSHAVVILKKITNTILAFMTLILIATALSKMILYIQRFDLTVLRLFSSAVLVLIAIGFFVSVLTQWIKPVKTAPVLIIIALLLLLVTPFLNVNGLVAKYNVDAYLQREMESVPENSIDTSYLIDDLGDAAIPEAIRLLKSGTLPEEETLWLNQRLKNRYDALSQLDFSEQTITGCRALQAMEQSLF